MSTTSIDTDGSHNGNFIADEDVETTFIAIETIDESTGPVGGYGLKPGIGGTAIKSYVV